MRTSRTGTWRGRQGFSLIELLIVVALLGIFSLLVTPRVRKGFYPNDIRGTVGKLSAVIGYLRSEAALNRIRYRLYYDIEKGRYWAAYQEPSDGSYRRLQTDLMTERSLPPGIRFKDIDTPREGQKIEGIAYTGFSPNGIAEQTVIHLSEGEDRQYTLIIMPLTGRLKIYDRYVGVER